ncbi:MAG TPA: MBL fold metallo-hydrolase, partial [Lentzea sp.]
FRLGHSTLLVKLRGGWWITDPVFAERASPVQWFGPKRFHAPPIALEDLPPLRGVLLSHDHYDHLDMATVDALVAGSSAVFVVPLGLAAHLRRWNVPEHRIVELDWDESHSVDGFTLTCTAAQHFSGRSVQRNVTLWASWVIKRGTRSVFYSGDTGYFPGYRAIGAEHGPFDVTLMQVGAYGDAWPDIHMTPEEGVQAFEDLGGGLLIPVHWATFNLALHSWTEPVDRVWREAKARGLKLAVPRPGERVDVDAPNEVDGWWQALA